MKVVELFTGSLSHLSARLPLWARSLLVFWIFLSGAIYFGWVDLQVENQVLRILIMAPMVIVVGIIVATMVVILATWVSWPLRKAAKLIQEKRNG